MKRNFLIEKKRIVKKIIQKEKMKTTPQLFCVAEDWMLLEGGVLYGFTRFWAHLEKSYIPPVSYIAVFL